MAEPKQQDQKPVAVAGANDTGLRSPVDTQPPAAHADQSPAVGGDGAENTDAENARIAELAALSKRSAEIAGHSQAVRERFRGVEPTETYATAIQDDPVVLGAEDGDNVRHSEFWEFQSKRRGHF